jgi:hypothetical protein
MGLKTDSFPTNSRSNKMTPRDLKIKQIVETTRCTHSEAEEALQENANELEAAVSWILDHTGDNVWTESKTRKAKKTDVVVVEEQQRPERPPRGESGNRRGGRRGGGTTRGGSNNVNWKPGQVFTRSEVAPKSTTPENTNNFAPNSGSVAPPVTNAATSTNSDNSAQASVKPAPVMKNAAGPMSFAAICALGGKKPAPPQAAPAPSSSAMPKPTTPATTPVKPVQSSQVSTSSTAKESSPAPHDTPVKPSVSKPEPVTPEASSTERFTESNTVQSLTSQLKNDLGLGSTSAKQVSSPTSNLISSSASPATTALPTRGIVEFVSDLNTNKSYDYHFGFNPESSTTVEESSFKSSNNSASAQNDYRSHENDVYKSSNVDSSSPANKPLASAVSQLSNSYGMQHPQQQQGSLASQQQPRRTAFGYAETSTVSYPPESRPAVNTTPAAPVTTTPALSNYTKPAVTAQSSYSHTQQQQQHPQQMQQQQPLHQQHTSQQQMYNPMYGAYPYLNLYSPVAGRAEDTPYATPYHMPYAYGMDVNSIAQMMPQMHPLQAAVPSHHQQQQQPTHRADHHQNFSDMKQTYGQSATANPNASAVNPAVQRDANISSTNVPPPPGFSGPPANMFPSQHMPHMFNVNHYPTMFMKQMPNQMYGQQNVDDSMDTRHQTQAKMYGQSDKYSNGSNVRDRMAMGGAAQPTPPPAQGGYGGAGGQQNSYPGNGQMNSVLNPKKPYHGGQWTNN